MTYIVNDNCIKCKYMDCVEVCPVDCFYKGENMLVIHPDECIDCGHCQSKFYTACLRIRAGQSSTVFAHESPTRSAGFDAENGLYLFALTVPRPEVVALAKSLARKK